MMRTGRFRAHAPAGAWQCLATGWCLLPLLLGGCQTTGKDTIAQLRKTQIEIREEKIEDGTEKAMEGYRSFVEQTPDSNLKAEAMRRLADLKVEKEYGVLARDSVAPQKEAPGPGPGTATAAEGPAEDVDDLERVGAREAIEIYKKLLKQYPTYERNDQVLYQMSRAYEELGRIKESMQVMDRLVSEYPRSRFFDEVQFRRGEYFFTRKRYLDAEEAYASVTAIGQSSSYYQLALYKLGWAFYKQDLYEKAVDQFIALLDHKVSKGYDFAQTGDEAERKRIDDTFRVISLSFSNLGGPGPVVEYFIRQGKRSYEDGVYANLAEFYFDKRRYGDAAGTYATFVAREPFHKASPGFQMRVIEIHLAGGFPSLVIDAKRQFAEKYGIKAEYWLHFERSSRPEVLVWLKKNLVDLARHYHALFQSPRQVKEKSANFEEALRWYREFLASFPKDLDTPPVHYAFADLFLENRLFDRAAQEYEKTAYEYPRHKKSSQAGYAAIYAWRQHLAGAAGDARELVTKAVVASSIRFAGAYPEHEKAAVVLGAAAEDLFAMKDLEQAVVVARNLIAGFPRADKDTVRAAWLVVGHGTYELQRYREAETAYRRVLALLPARDKSREARIDNLAAAIYKQGEQASAKGDHRTAAVHFLEIGKAAPASRIRVNAEYDAAAALIQAGEWKMAAGVLERFRILFPGHALQSEVTKKIAYVYREDGQLSLAASEYERIERESADDEAGREALLAAAELHEKAGNQSRRLAVYRRYLDRFPTPVEPNVETRDRIAEMLKQQNDNDGYFAELRQIVATDAGAGSERTQRTRAIAGKAALVLAGPAFERFAGVKLVEPVSANLNRKKELMKIATQQFNQLLDYEIGDTTAAAAFYLAEIYAVFSRDLKESERPAGLSALEREEYDLAIEEQAYPFEEKAIATHQSNLELVSRGVYNEWIDKSLQKLVRLLPARYDKPEEESPLVTALDGYVFVIDPLKPPLQQASQGATAQAAGQDAPQAEKALP